MIDGNRLLLFDNGTGKDVPISRAVEYDWRRGRVQVAASADHLFELNNFNSLRGGVLGRFPSKGVIWRRLRTSCVGPCPMRTSIQNWVS